MKDVDVKLQYVREKFKVKEPNIFRAAKGFFVGGKDEEIAQSVQKIAVSLQYLHQKWIFLRKLKQLLGKRENLQKFKQNEHQVLSHAHKKG